MIRNAWDKPMAASQLVGEFNPALGHCTFIAGIVRQVAPDARVLAVRILHSDDVAYEGDIICALRHLIKRIELAAAGDLAGMVDVVSLSFGYFSEAPYTRPWPLGCGRRSRHCSAWVSWWSPRRVTSPRAASSTPRRLPANPSRLARCP